MADDSGIEVDALGGAPGVRSRRFAQLPEGTSREIQDRANNARLLELLTGVEPARRTARYVCVAAFEGEGGDGDGDGVTLFRGTAEGVIAEAPRGSGGFGYDPLFFDPELERTFGELTAAEKDARSHRGRAFRALAKHLKAREEPPAGPGPR